MSAAVAALVLTDCGTAPKATVSSPVVSQPAHTPSQPDVEAPTAGYSWVAAVRPDDSEKAFTALAKGGVAAVIQGSHLYGIFVKPAVSKRAVKILRDDSKQRHYFVDFGDPSPGNSPHKAPAKPK